MSTGVEHRADSREWRTDLCVVRDVNNVAGKCDSESRAEAWPVNRGERWRGKRCDLADDRIDGPLEDRLAILVAGIGFGEIAAGAESRPLAANQHCTNLLLFRALK